MDRHHPLQVVTHVLPHGQCSYIVMEAAPKLEQHLHSGDPPDKCMNTRAALDGADSSKGIHADSTTGEADISGFHADLSRGDADLSGGDADLSGGDADLSSRDADLNSHHPYADPSSRDADPSSRDADPSSRDADLSSRDADLSSRDADPSSRDADPSSRDADLSSCDADLSSRDADLSSRDAHLSSRDADLSSRDADPSSRNADLSRHGLHADLSRHGADSTSDSTSEQYKSCSTVFFFPGDQPSDDVMPDHALWLKDPQQQLGLIASKFPTSTTLLVMPARLHEDTFACFDQFLQQTTASGEPFGYKGQGYKALRELYRIWQELMPSDGPAAERSVLGEVALVGFSKGGVVVNQVLAELALMEEESSAAAVAGSSPSLSFPCVKGSFGSASEQVSFTDFANSITAIHYLDVGLNCRGAYFTDPRDVAQLGALAQRRKLKICLHGTPRQWGDPGRVWLRAEKDRMRDLLGKAGVCVKELLYFEGQKGSLVQHFEIVQAMELL